MEIEELFKINMGRIIRAHRKHMGITSEELAHRAGFHHTHLNKIELGKSMMSQHIFFKIAAGLNKSPSLLTKEIEEEIFSLYKEDVKSRT
ncbi:helix-turn-helix domain-containing protein [Bacillus salacetis]|uniref:helix-turn-helix domain-containing protein n=1 Tax=Bacillus salacetis TaxID=2315464 RepID=UPI003B9F97C1